ncbi:MAG: hypothetical protein NVV73_14005 [Cellvibrionaceae bacterium]|nr:hypothetical protein [Cellvibrionaceae bacterium]
MGGNTARVERAQGAIELADQVIGDRKTTKRGLMHNGPPVPFGNAIGFGF